MEQEYPIELAARCVGRLRVEDDGLYHVFRAECALDTDRIYRLTLCGAEGTLPLGVLEPSDGVLRLVRRLSAATVRRIGQARAAHIEAGEALTAQRRNWTLLDGQRPFACGELSDALAACKDALFRREGEHSFVALPLLEGEPFPLEPLFCFASVCTVEGKSCAVFSVDRDGEPIFQEN